jgi:hypothetical protein
VAGGDWCVRAWNVWSVHVELCKNDMQLCSWGVARVMVSETGVCDAWRFTEGVD